ncbi:hypothetical protein ACIOHC_36220 [Streptomyces sp. NPDC088252]|uniref:hypothetical protein n=1 Tax=Streptomyces sp. NPDC088252 TaxID=3365845 RepID=UPI00380BEA6A
MTNVIGQAGKAPKGVSTDRHGEQAKDIAPAARKRGKGTADLGEKREIVIMIGHKVPYPLMGDRRALIAPGFKGGTKGVRNPRMSRAFGIVEFAGRKCVRVHGGTDDYAQAQAIAAAAARKVHAWLNREILRTAARGGAVIGKALPPVKVIDRTGIYPGPKRNRAPKRVDLTRSAGKVYSRVMTDAERAQHDHARSIQTDGRCPACEGTKTARVKNARCVAAPVSEAVKEMRAELSATDRAETAKANADAMTAALQEAFQGE